MNRRGCLRASCAVAAWLALAVPASAQGFGGVATVGVGTIDYISSNEKVLQVSGAGLWRFGTSRFSLGGQGDLLIGEEGVGGRGGPFAQVDLRGLRKKVQPFVVGGRFAADGGAQWMFGGGLDLFLGHRAGLRVVAQDAFARTSVSEMGRADRTISIHEPSLQVGFVYR